MKTFCLIKRFTFSSFSSFSFSSSSSSSFLSRFFIPFIIRKNFLVTSTSTSTSTRTIPITKTLSSFPIKFVPSAFLLSLSLSSSSLAFLSSRSIKSSSKGSSSSSSSSSSFWERLTEDNNNNNNSSSSSSSSSDTDTNTEMAWYSHGKNNEDLINSLERNKLVKSKRVIEAMKLVDRGDFAPSDPYIDSPQYIGHGATISAPHMHAYALEMLDEKLQQGNTVLDVGSGSGYLCAVIAHLVGEKGKVIGIEHIKELVDLSIKNINKHHADLIKSKRLVIIHGDGRKGYKEGGPYDCIHVGAGAGKDVPAVLCEQLKEGGILVTPVELGKYSGQIFRIYKKSNGKITYKNLVPVQYVPLTDPPK